MSFNDDDGSGKDDSTTPPGSQVYGPKKVPMSDFGYKTATQWGVRWGKTSQQVNALKYRLLKTIPNYVATTGPNKSKFAQISFAASVDTPRRTAKLELDKATKSLLKQTKLDEAPVLLGVEYPPGHLVDPASLSPSQIMQGQLKEFPLSEILLHALERASDLEKVVGVMQGISHQIHIPAAPED
jgi:hypothetical protein